MYRFVGTRISTDAAGREQREPLEPLSGIGVGDHLDADGQPYFEDAEFEARVARYEAQFVDGAGSVARSGLYVHTPDAPAAPRRSRGAAPDANNDEDTATSAE